MRKSKQQAIDQAGLPALEGPKGRAEGPWGPYTFLPLWAPPYPIFAYYSRFLRFVGLIPMVFYTYSFGLCMASIGGWTLILPHNP